MAGCAFALHPIMILHRQTHLSFRLWCRNDAAIFRQAGHDVRRAPAALLFVYSIFSFTPCWSHFQPHFCWELYLPVQWRQSWRRCSTLLSTTESVACVLLMLWHTTWPAEKNMRVLLSCFSWARRENDVRSEAAELSCSPAAFNLLKATLATYKYKTKLKELKLEVGICFKKLQSYCSEPSSSLYTIYCLHICHMHHH